MQQRPIMKFLFIVIAVALLASAAFPQSKKDQKRARELTDQADTAFRAKDYRNAADEYGQAIAIVPNNPNAHYWKAVSHYYMKENAAAEQEFEVALNQGFKPIEVYRIRWFLFYDEKNYDAAMTDLTKALEIEPKNLNFLKGLGEVYYAKGDYPGALKTFQRAVLVDAKDGDIYFNIARTQAAMGHVREQGLAADEALQKGTRMVGESYFLLADAQQKQKDIDNAAVSYQKAIAAKPDNYQAYRNLSDIYRSQYKFNDAIEISKKAIIQFPNDGNVYTDLAWYYSLNDRPVDAAKNARIATQLLPDQYMGFTNLCRALNDLQNYADAITACNTALKLNPGDGETYFYLARAYDLLGRKADATPLYGRAVKGLEDFTDKNPDYADGFYLLGNAYFANNQVDKAIESYLKCIKLSPRFARARFNLGMVYLVNKDKAGATDQYTALLDLDADRAAQLKAKIDGK